MLEKLDYGGKRIFTAELNEDKTHIRLTEMCDLYFWHDLTKAEVYELADDLRKLADQIVDT